jgi:hypothetical protein
MSHSHSLIHSSCHILTCVVAPGWVPLLGHRLALLTGPWAAPFSNLALNLFGAKPAAAAAAAAAAAGAGATMLLQIGPASMGRQLAAACVVDEPEDGAAMLFTDDPVVVAELLARQVGGSSSSSSVATCTSCHNSSDSMYSRSAVARQVRRQQQS